MTNTKITQKYPAEEIEWLATTTFNRGVDFYCIGQDVDCKRWIEKSIELAKILEDEGALVEVLQEKYLGLAWEA